MADLTLKGDQTMSWGTKGFLKACVFKTHFYPLAFWAAALFLGCCSILFHFSYVLFLFLYLGFLLFLL